MSQQEQLERYQMELSDTLKMLHDHEEAARMAALHADFLRTKIKQLENGVAA